MSRQQPDNIIVLGGSFNPPTRAHYDIMAYGCGMFPGRSKGLFVPSSDFYVRRKCDKHCHDNRRALDFDLRAGMLAAMCHSAVKSGIDMVVSQCEHTDNSKGRTLETLDHIQACYPNAKIWFVMGSDKLGVFQRWPTKKTILEKYGLLVMLRDDKLAKTDPDVDRAIQDKTIRFMPLPSDCVNISSTEYWVRVNAGQDPSELLHDAAWNFMAGWQASQNLPSHGLLKAYLEY